MNTTSNEKSYFDLHTSGIGYIQRVREVPVRGGRRAQPFLACTVAALVGSAKDPSYRYFDVKVSGAEAKKLVERYIGVDDPKQRPLVRFRLGDLWGDAYIRDKGERKGEAAASLKARLLKTEPLDRAELASIKQHELITRGIGYLSRPKDVTPKDGDPFLSCCVAALAGPVGEPDYRYFDTIVATPEAEHLVRRCVQAIEGDRKVLIAFKLNDMKIDPYIRTKGERAGEPGASLESTLIHIGLIKIDGTQVYPTSQAVAENDAEAPKMPPAAMAKAAPNGQKLPSWEGSSTVTASPPKAQPVSDVMEDMLAMVSTSGSPGAEQDVEPVAQRSYPADPSTPMPATAAVLPSPPPSTAKPPLTAAPPSGEHFMMWLKQGIASRRLIINDAKALVHSVNDTAYLVSPGVFQRYVQEHPHVGTLARQDKMPDWQWVQKRFEKLGLHRKHDSGLNIWICEVTGPRKSRKLHGYLLIDANWLFDAVPPNNPYLRVTQEI